MIYTCYHPMCHYIFASDKPPERCPDCGHDLVRPATDKERAEYEAYRKEAAPKSKCNIQT